MVDINTTEIMMVRLFLKTSNTLVAGHRKVKLELNRKLSLLAHFHSVGRRRNYISTPTQYWTL